MHTFKTSIARENILGKIRKELSGCPIPMPFPEVDKTTDDIYTTVNVSDEELFAENFIKIGGKYFFCENEQELIDNITILIENKGWNLVLCADKRLLKLFNNNKIDILTPANPNIENAEACITSCEAIIARTGSIMVSSKQNFGRTSPVFYPIHIVFAYLNQVVRDIEDGFNLIKKKYGSDMPSMISLATGPSRTADIEKTLVVGVHGPKEVFCFFINVE